MEKKVAFVEELEMNFDEVEFSDIQDIEEVVTPGWGTHTCCT